MASPLAPDHEPHRKKDSARRGFLGERRRLTAQSSGPTTGAGKRTTSSRCRSHAGLGGGSGAGTVAGECAKHVPLSLNKRGGGETDRNGGYMLMQSLRTKRERSFSAIDPSPGCRSKVLDERWMVDSERLFSMLGAQQERRARATECDDPIQGGRAAKSARQRAPSSNLCEKGSQPDRLCTTN